MANFKRTYINADEELVIQGKLTIEGQLEQKEFVESTSYTQTNFAGDVLVVNSDGFTKDVSPTATNSELKLRSGDANASLLFNSIAGTLTLSTSPAIATTLSVTGDIAATDITASGTVAATTLTGNFTGTAATATALANSRNFSITGDVTASAIAFDGTTDVVLSSNIAAGVVGTTELANGSVTNDKLSGVNTTNVAEGTRLYYTDARSRAAISVTDSGGGGSLAYNNSTGVITYTGPTDSQIRALVSATGTGLTYNNSTGVFTLNPGAVIGGSTTSDLPEGTNLYYTNARVDTHLSGSTGITYTGGAISITNTGVTGASYGSATAVPTFTVNSQGQLTAAADVNIAVTASQVTDFSEAVDDRVDALVVAGTGITKAYNDAAGTYTLTTTDADIVHDNLSGFVANEHIDHSAVSIASGTGLQGGGDITTTRTLSIDNTVATLTGSQTLTNKTLTDPVISNIAGNSQVTGDLNITGALNVVGNLNSATQTDSFVTTKKLTLNVGGGASPDASRVEVDRTGTGSNVYLRWNETGDRWMFSNDGTTNLNMLIESDVEGFFSAVDAGGDGSFSYNNAGVFTYTGPSAAEARAHISVTDTGGDGSLAYNSGTGVITYTGPSQAEVQTHISNSATQVRAHFTGGTAISLTGGTIALDTVPDTITFAQGHVKFSNNSIGIGPSAGTFNSTEANSIAIGHTAGATSQQAASVAIGNEAGKDNQKDTSVAIGYKAGWQNQGERKLSGTGTGSAVGIGTLAGYSNQGEYSIAIGESAGLVQQQEHSIAIGKRAGNLAQSAYSIAMGVDAGKTSQGDYSIAIGHKAGESSQAADTIVLRAGDSTFPYPAAATAGATYISPIRNTTSDTGKVLMYNDSTYEVSRVPSTVFLTASGNQSIAGTKTFTGSLIVPDSATATNGAIYVDNSASKAYVYVNGAIKEITPAVDAGDVEDVGVGDVNLYAGSRTSGSTTIHGIKSLTGGTGVTLAETGNVVTVNTDAFRTDSNVRALFSAVDSSGDGALTYNAATGVFTYSGITDSQVRGKISGTGLISYNNSTGVISTTADNFGSFTVKTDTGNAGAEAISSGETLTFVGGTNTTVTNSGNTITIRNDNAADIEAVTAGSGMTGGGSSGSVTLNVIGGDGITANADDVQVDSTVVRTTGAQSIAGAKTLSTELILPDNVLLKLGSNASDFNIVHDASGSIGIGNNNTNYLMTENHHLAFMIKPSVGVDFTDSGPSGYFGYGTTIQGVGDANTFYASYNGTTKFITTNTGVRTVGTVSVNNAYTLPTSDGTSGQVLTTDGSGALTFQTSTVGDVTEVVAGAGLTGGGTSGSLTLNAVGGTGITVNANSIEANMSDIRASIDGADLDMSGNKVLFGNMYATEGDLPSATTYHGMFAHVHATGKGYFAHGGAWKKLLDESTSTTSDLTEGTNLYYTNTRARAAISASGDISYNSSTGVISFTNDAGDIEGVTAGAGLSGGGTSGTVTLTHADTSSQASVNNSGRTYIQDVTLDTYGHVTGLTSATETVVDTNTTYTAGTDLSLSGTTFNVTSATANTGSTLVKRDAGGDFSAGTITADLTGDVTGRADAADNVKITATGDVNQNLLMVFTDTTSSTNNSAVLYKHNPIYYNPQSDTLNAGNFAGLASTAKYADLAERYEPDADYEPGTVVVLGGEKEITVTDQMSSTKVAGVISTDPGYLMNAEANGLPVALRGRVPTKVIGSVQKGDVLITSTTPGFAMAAAHPQNVSASEMIGKALQSKEDSGEGVIEALI